MNSVGGESTASNPPPISIHSRGGELERRLRMELLVEPIRPVVARPGPGADGKGGFDPVGEAERLVAVEQPAYEEASATEDRRPQQGRGQLLGRDLDHLRVARLHGVEVRLGELRIVRRLAHELDAGEVPKPEDASVALEIALLAVLARQLADLVEELARLDRVRPASIC